MTEVPLLTSFHRWGNWGRREDKKCVRGRAGFEYKPSGSAIRTYNLYLTFSLLGNTPELLGGKSFKCIQARCHLCYIINRIKYFINYLAKVGMSPLFPFFSSGLSLLKWMFLSLNTTWDGEWFSTWGGEWFSSLLHILQLESDLEQYFEAFKIVSFRNW